MIRLRAAAPALLLGAGAVLVLLTFRDYGMTWDETVEGQYGGEVLDYFLSGFQDTRCNDLTNMRHYAPLFDVAAAALGRLWPTATVELRHLLIAALGVATAAGLFRLAKQFFSPATGILAALFLATLPRFYGDAFNNPKDVPFACAFTWFVASAAPLVTRTSTSWRAFLACGACLGWVGASRAGGLPIAILVACAAAAVHWLATRGAAPAAPPAMERARLPAPAWLARLSALFALAWVCMIVPWPWAHAGPLTHPVESMREAAKFSETYEVLFAGSTVMSDQLPRTYIVHFLLISTPLLTLAFAAAGIGLALRTQWKSPHETRSAVYVLLTAWLVIPMVLFVALRPNVYDGIRHFLFVLPAVAAFAAIGAHGLVAGLRKPALRWAAAAAVAAALLVPAVAMVRLHPYQTTFFNALVGGVGGASGRYETDYWASSYKEAAEWVNEHRTVDPARPTTVMIAANPYSLPCATYYLSPDIHALELQGRFAPGSIPPDVDYFIAVTRFRLDESFPETPVLHRVGRLGATFSVIRGRP